MLNIDNNYKLNIVCYLFFWLFGLAPSNPGFQELNNQLRYGQYHLPKGVAGLVSLAYNCNKLQVTSYKLQVTFLQCTMLNALCTIYDVSYTSLLSAEPGKMSWTIHLTTP